MSIGNRLKEVRKQFEKTQTEWAEMLGVSRDTINNIENDRLKKPQQYDPLYKLVTEKFGVSYSWLKTGEGEMFLPSTKSEEIANFASHIINDENAKFKRRLVLALSQLSDDQWDAIEAVVDKIIEQED